MEREIDKKLGKSYNECHLILWSGSMKQKIGKPLAILLSAALTLVLLIGMVFQVGTPMTSAGTKAAKLGILDKFDMYMTNTVSDALDGVLSVEKVYWLSDEDLVAPEPDPDSYGKAEDPAQLQWLLDAAAELLDGQQTVFTTETEIKQGSEITYYLDETIFAVTWKQKVGKAVYTFSEVKIAHPSQFRRFLSGGEYGSGKLYTTTEMAASVNAVTASSGDYYSFRPFGISVYDGVVCRSSGYHLDTCFIDENGDLHFVSRETFSGEAEVEQYVADNRIRFSLSFGPILIENGEVVTKDYYPLGEVFDRYSRAAICQQGELHYVLVTSNMETPYVYNPTTHTFASELQKMGIRNAYSLDGGQTAVIVTGDELINSVDFGYQRQISDIIYFATAVPDGNG